VITSSVNHLVPEVYGFFRVGDSGGGVIRKEITDKKVMFMISENYCLSNKVGESSFCPPGWWSRVYRYAGVGL
jgi:hypothetical protein